MYKIDKQWPETCWQDGRIEGHELTLSYQNNKIATYCSTTIDQKNPGIYQKRYATSKDKE